MTIPEPLVNVPSPIAWGFIICHIGMDGFDRHDKYWFDTHSEMICFLCLGASEYLSSSDESPGALDAWKGRCKALDEKFLPTIEASRHGKDHIVRAMFEIANCFDPDDSLVWYGQFCELVGGQTTFSEKLISQYFSDCGFVDTPTTIVDVDRFQEWLVEFEGFMVN